jgi:curli biogenesis system outer membrane secretion channel CsgG
MTRRFEVVERQLLNKVLEEQNLGMTGILDESSAARIGKNLGVDANCYRIHHRSWQRG